MARLIHYAIGDYARPAPGRSVPRRTAGRSTQPGLLAVGGSRELLDEARHRRSHRLLPDPNGPGEPSGASESECVDMTWEAKARARHRLESKSSGVSAAGGEPVG